MGFANKGANFISRKIEHCVQRTMALGEWQVGLRRSTNFIFKYGIGKKVFFAGDRIQIGKRISPVFPNIHKISSRGIKSMKLHEDIPLTPKYNKRTLLYTLGSLSSGKALRADVLAGNLIKSIEVSEGFINRNMELKKSLEKAGIEVFCVKVRAREKSEQSERALESLKRTAIAEIRADKLLKDIEKLSLKDVLHRIHQLQSLALNLQEDINNGIVIDKGNRTMARIQRVFEHDLEPQLKYVLIQIVRRSPLGEKIEGYISKFGIPSEYNIMRLVEGQRGSLEFTNEDAPFLYVIKEILQNEKLSRIVLIDHPMSIKDPQSYKTKIELWEDLLEEKVDGRLADLLKSGEKKAEKIGDKGLKLYFDDKATEDKKRIRLFGEDEKYVPISYAA